MAWGHLMGNNPGAERAVNALLATPRAQEAAYRLHDAGIAGAGVWVLYSDRCECDAEKLAELLLSSSNHEIRWQARERWPR